MPNPWTMKMEQFTAFSDMEKRRLDELIAAKRQEYAPKEDIIADGAHSGHCHVVLSGLACRYKMLPDGSRQIMAFLIPGDLCDAEIFILKKMDHGVAAITPTTTALIPAEAMKTLLRETSSLGEMAAGTFDSIFPGTTFTTSEGRAASRPGRNARRHHTPPR